MEEAAFCPFLLLSDPTPVRDAAGLVELAPLDGPGSLRWRARFAGWRDALAARERCRAADVHPPGGASPYRFLSDPVHQYLLQSGRTSFQGLRFGDLRRLALDLEVITSEGYDFPSAARPGDRIVAVALADSTGYRAVLRGDVLDEPALIAECGRLIRERDPDVVEGHNIFRFDLEYLEARARRHGVPLAWGRDGSLLRGRPARLAVAERAVTFRRYELAGRHIVDTWMLALLHDVGARDLPSFGLKDIARHLGVSATDRTYVDGARVTAEFHEAPDRLMAYAADDAVETLAVSAILSPPYFAQAQMVPFDYQTVMLRGSGAKIDALLMREYLRRGRAVPLPGPAAPVGGGLTAVWQRGVARPVLHVDVTSLYPSLMIAGGVAPRTDALGVFLDLLRHLRDVRVAAKRRAQTATDSEERAHHGALQASFKILINSFYGYLAFTAGHWNDFAAADRVTAEGRAVVSGIVEALRTTGATPLEADTDGVYFVPPSGHEAGDDGALLERIAAALPGGISLELDGRYAAMLSYKIKTYALLDERGGVILRGSAFRSRGLEPFQRRLIEEIVTRLLHGQRAEVKVVVDRWLADFAAHRVEPRLFARTETLGEPLEVYRQRVLAGLRPPAAAYEVAAASGRAWSPGDQISYYVAGRGAHPVVSERARLLVEWNPAHPDENVEYYQAKVIEVWERFRPFTEQDGLVPVSDLAEAATQLELF